LVGQERLPASTEALLATLSHPIVKTCRLPKTSPEAAPQQTDSSNFNTATFRLSRTTWFRNVNVRKTFPPEKELSYAWFRGPKVSDGKITNFLHSGDNCAVWGLTLFALRKPDYAELTHHFSYGSSERSDHEQPAPH
jgi:hypothetical protein